MPVSGLSVTPFQPNSGVVVFHKRTAPLDLRRATKGASSSQGPLSFVVKDPRRVDQPFVATKSFIVVGTPSTNPAGVPIDHLSSEALALFRAFSSSTNRNAFNFSS